ncbi:sodium:solute symporter [Actinopolyspora erythraea]|uniref:Sodium:solute symporter n=1 Tax=Actinopolyspora erythraea TaxID=414996 RepID=A0A099D4T1_9ACTN|nr:sodium:solute symporter [Actinopolyspora erythraea]ASU79438.1 sodium:solute symporter [Actinopolyspora erythraea]KGI80941.1 sodium:solute symporter [Actinopolyspora erythraea]
MTVTFGVALAGMLLIGVLGFLGRRGRTTGLSQWAVGNRGFGVLTTWFLQAGEVFTTFTFLGVAGLAFTGGAAATYAVPYMPLAFVGLYFLGPRVWRLGSRHGYVTQADFYEHRYGSEAFGTLVAVTGVVFLLPYLQLQITGLGMIVTLVTGSESSGTLSMVVATGLTVLFVLWSGIRGVAATAYLKDVLILLAMVVLAVVIPLHYAGGIGSVFAEIGTSRPEMLRVAGGEYGPMWWFTGMLISTIGSMFLTLPHLWPPLLSAGGPRALRRNYMFLPLYQVVIILPILIGYTGALALPPGTDGDGVLLTLAAGALPDWATGVVAVAAASAAMVPAAALCMGMSTLVANNVVRSRDHRLSLVVNHGVVVVVAVLALVLGIVRPDLLANLLLLTFSGLAQLAPSFVAALGERPWLSARSAVSGLLAGELVVVWLTFTDVATGDVNVGLFGLAANIAVAATAEFLRRARARNGSAPTTSVERPQPARK